jgi:hypothetical protein
VALKKNGGTGIENSGTGNPGKKNGGTGRTTRRRVDDTMKSVWGGYA